MLKCYTKINRFLQNWKINQILCNLSSAERYMNMYLETGTFVKMIIKLVLIYEHVINSYSDDMLINKS